MSTYSLLLKILTERFKSADSEKQFIVIIAAVLLHLFVRRIIGFIMSLITIKPMIALLVTNNKYLLKKLCIPV